VSSATVSVSPPSAEPVAPSAPPTLVEWTVAAAFGLATLALLAPWPAPSVRLRDVCTLSEAGRFGAECDLRAAAERAQAPWLRKRIRVNEDGFRLIEVASEVQPQGDARGSFYTDGARLLFSALARSDPRSNGRTYVARPDHWDPLGVAAWRPLAAALLLVTGCAVCLVRRRRAFAQAWPIVTLVSISALAVQWTAVGRALVPVDAGDTLGAAEAITRGAVPYRTLYYSPYTPLGAYAFSLWGRLWPGSGPPPYDWYVGLVVLCEIACSAIVFLLLARDGVRRGLAVVTALSLLSMTLLFDGARVLHEPLYLVMILASAWLAPGGGRPQRGLVAGALTAGAFLVKQYGGFGLLGLVAHALTGGRHRGQRAAWIVAGFVLGFGALAALLVLLGGDLASLARGLAPKAPVTYQLTFFEQFLRDCPIVLPALIVPLLAGAWSRPVVRLAVCFGLASCLPLFFRQHQYYFLNLCPWLFMLFAAGVDHVPRAGRGIALGAALVLLVSIPLRAAVGDADVIEVDWRADQVRRAHLMNLLWPAEKPTFVFVHPGIQHLTHYRSPDEGEVGYRYIVDLSADRLRAGFQRAAAAWIDPKGMFARRPDATLREAGSSLANELEKNGFQRQLVLENRFQLWTKEPLSRRQSHAAGDVKVEGLGDRAGQADDPR
jgi:hypothetical protein